ncbi:hypothetical protein BH23BAC3_BH23BAC3_30750 [soil metagenome]
MLLAKKFIYPLFLMMPMLYIVLTIKMNYIDVQQVPEQEVQTETPIEFKSYTHLSMKLVEAVRDGKPTDEMETILAEVSLETLYDDLKNESHKKAFWLNVYNAYVQILLLDKPELFEDRNSWFGYNFFTSPQITIAGKELSFDDIEHGIMRRSKMKISMGYLNSWFVDDFIKKFWWEEVDPRIHFAVNCGAASCPYIAVYDPQRVEEQLDIATRIFLAENTTYYPEEDRVEVTRLMCWFRGDFGGVSGAFQMLKDYGVIPEDADPNVDFMEYDWTIELGNYQVL